MKKILISTCVLFIAGAASAAGIPTMNYTCPTGIELHVAEGGYVYINGKEAKLKKVNDNYFEVKGNGVSVEVMTNPDGTRNVTYTGKHGANGLCSEADFSRAAPAPAAGSKKTTAMPKNLASLCKGEAAGQFNVKPIYVQVGKPFESKTGYAVKGTGDLGNEGKKPFQCNFDQNGKLLDFQSLVNEGSL